MNTLYPCPFCGSEAKMDPATSFWRVDCKGCEAKSKLFPKPEQAVAAWNARPDQCDFIECAEALKSWQEINRLAQIEIFNMKKKMAGRR